MNPAGQAMMGVREEREIVGMPYLQAVAGRRGPSKPKDASKGAPRAPAARAPG